jgi:hypothetical protein
VNAATGNDIRRFESHEGAIRSAKLSLDGRWIISSSGKTLEIWSVQNGQFLATLVSSSMGVGRYPTRMGDMMKQRFYTPGLLASILGFNSESLPQVVGLKGIELWPSVQYDPPKPGTGTLRLHLTNRGGGIGQIVVKVNGREVPKATRGDAPADHGASDVPIDLGAAQLRSDGKNEIEVITYGKSNLVASRGIIVPWVLSL